MYDSIVSIYIKLQLQITNSQYILANLFKIGKKYGLRLYYCTASID